MKEFYIYFILIILAFASCKKTNTTTDQSYLLTHKSWKPALTDKNTSTNPEGTANVYHATLNCERDDSYSFEDKLTINRGDDKCNSSEISPDVSDYTVDFTARKIAIKGITYDLAEVSATQLKYYAPVPTATGYNYIIYLFEH